jgi:hypothetical protein
MEMKYRIKTECDGKVVKHNGNIVSRDSMSITPRLEEIALNFDFLFHMPSFATYHSSPKNFEARK